MCKAFKTNRLEIGFANANHYDYADRHLEETHAYMSCALFLLKEELRRGNLEELIEEVYNNGYSLPLDKLNEVLERLNEAKII